MTDVISIHGLDVMCAIGIWDWEQDEAQKLSLDLDLHCDFAPVIASRQLSDTINYADVTRQITALLQSENFGFLEVVVDRVCALVFASWPSVTRLRLAVRKFPRDMPEVSAVGVRRDMSRDEWLVGQGAAGTTTGTTTE